MPNPADTCDHGRDERMVRAMLCHELNGPDCLTLGNIPGRPPMTGEVRIRTHACAVNFPDLLMTRGLYQVKPEPPFAPGMEVSGIVTEVGEGVSAFSLGDRVIARCMGRYPGFAEEVTVPVELVMPVPADIDDISAAALFLTYYTSYNALIDKACLQPGEWVLIHGAAGGVGLAAVQIAKAVGAKVIATAGSAEKVRFLLDEGADAAIDYSHEDIRTRVLSLTGEYGVDVVLDPVGGDAFDASLRCLAPEGRLLVVGFTSGKMSTPKSNIILIKEISVIGVRAGEYAARHPEQLRAAMRQFGEWYTAGKIAPRIARTFPLERAADAVKALEDRSVIGKVVVTMV